MSQNGWKYQVAAIVNRTSSTAPARDTERAEPAEEREEPREEPPSTAPSGYDGLMSAGNEALRAGNNQEALNHFSNATDARPSSAEAHVGVARAYEAMGRLGDARRRSGDTRGACTAYQRVLSIVRTGRSADHARRATEDLGCAAE